jgi:ChrR Cupin-like domain
MGPSAGQIGCAARGTAPPRDGLTSHADTAWIVSILCLGPMAAGIISLGINEPVREDRDMAQAETPQVVICDTNQMPFEEVRRGRVHMIRRKRLPLDTGLPGVTMEYSLSIVPDGYFTPRHRHNFDQIRYTLTGIQSTGHGDLAAGEVGYFPEGSYYGPQKQEGECACLVLQFQGASGERLLSNEEMNATYDKLIKAGGKFENGVYKGFKPDGTPKNRDSYEAIWEAHEGHELAFPPPRYRDPVMMLADNARYWPDRKRPGIEIKHLGTFSEARTGLSFVRVKPGATIPAGTQEDAELRYCISGSFDYDGRPCGAGTYVYLPVGAATKSLHSAKGCEFFVIALPMLADLAAGLKAADARTGRERVSA